MINLTDVINAFPGYEFIPYGEDKKPHNMYRGTDIGFGGYIISNPGIYTNVALLDVASLHPNSIRAMNCFGEYTKNFTDILDARVAIKHKDFETARTMMGGKLAPYLNDESTAKDLAQALKIAINSVYGLTAANFDNPFRDIRNKNNIVALRGALFMRTLQDEVESRGFKIVAIKTDSIKIADATKDIIDFCMGFANHYGYTFEHEASYNRMCQINDADYIAKYSDPEWCTSAYGYVPGDNAKHVNEWTATGKQFQVPYVFKSLFSKEEIKFEDLCETKEVKTALYLDMNENLPQLTPMEEKELETIDKAWHSDAPEEMDKLIKRYNCEPEYIGKRYSELCEKNNNSHNYRFIGKVGLFCPVKSGCGGGLLLAQRGDKYYAATGTTGYRWLESEVVKKLNKEDDIDISYYDSLARAAIETISQYGDFNEFANQN